MLRCHTFEPPTVSEPGSRVNSFVRRIFRGKKTPSFCSCAIQPLGYNAAEFANEKDSDIELAGLSADAGRAAGVCPSNLIMYPSKTRALALLTSASFLALAEASFAQTAFTVDTNLVDVSRLLGNETDPSIAIEPGAPANLFVASGTDGANLGLLVARSTNSGASWTASLIATNGDPILVPAAGEPSVAWDTFSNLFIAYLPATDEGVAVVVSTNGGQTFAPLTNLVASDSTDTPRLTSPALGAAAGSVWLVYKDYTLAGTPLVAQGMQSTGLGTNGAFGLAEILPGSADGGFPDIVAGPDGQVMVAFQGNVFGSGKSPIYISVNTNAISTNGNGTTFNAPVEAVSDAIGGFTYTDAENTGIGLNAAAGLAWDGYNFGTNYGKAYLVYTALGATGNLLIHTCYSTNSGAKWSVPRQVNDDLNNPNDHFLPRIAVDPASGIIGYSWMDCRNDLGNATPPRIQTFTTNFTYHMQLVSNITVHADRPIQNEMDSEVDNSMGGLTNWTVAVSGDDIFGFLIATNSAGTISIYGTTTNTSGVFSSTTNFTIDLTTGDATNPPASSLVTVVITNILPFLYTDGVHTNREAMGYATISLDGGETFLPNQSLIDTNLLLNGPGDGYASDEFTSSNLTGWGHYTALAAYGASFYPVWPDNSDILANNPNGAGKQFDLYGIGGGPAGSVTVPTADLAISVTSTPSTVALGESLLLTLVVRNNGPSPGVNVVVTNLLPPNVTLGDVTPALGVYYANFDPSLVFYMPPMPANTALTNYIRVTPTTADYVTNFASITGPLTDLNPTNNTNQLIVPFVSEDLAVGAITPLSLDLGAPFLFTVTVTNLGPSTNGLVIVSNLFSTNLAILSANLPQGSATVATNGNTGVLLFNLGRLGVTQVVTMTVTAVAISAPPLASILTEVASGYFDPNLANNAVLNSITLQGEDLGLSMSAAPGTVQVGQTVTYMETVTNLGPSTNGIVFLTNTLSANLGQISVLQPAGNYTINGNVVVFNLGTIAAQQSVPIEFMATALSPGPGVNNGVVGSRDFDTDLLNNSAEATVTLIPTLPLISNLVVTPEASGAFIAFKTGELATAQVQYGLSTAYGSLTSVSVTPSSNHLFLLTGLARDASYYFNVQVWVGQKLYTTNGQFATVNTLILDTGDASYSGEWSTITVGSGIYGGEYRSASAVVGAETSSATYTPNIIVAGKYDVSIWYPVSSIFTTKAPIYVSGATNEIILSVNQTTNGGSWQPLASDLYFAAGTGGNVAIYNNTGETDKSVVANAMMWVYDPGQDYPANGSVPGWWANYYFGPNANISGSGDEDGDGYSNYAEYVFGTNPTDPSSYLNFAVAYGPDNVVSVSFSPWQGGRAYQLQSATDLSSGAWVTLTNTVTVNTNGDGVFTLTQPNPAASFYRLSAHVLPQ
jgi:uncharacterized repeat protein (TIGR01451 family)